MRKTRVYTPPCSALFPSYKHHLCCNFDKVHVTTAMAHSIYINIPLEYLNKISVDTNMQEINKIENKTCETHL